MSNSAAEPSLKVFAYLNADKSVLYQSIMRLFVKGKESYLLHLRPSDLVRELEEPPEQLEAALSQLCAWGNIQSHPDTSEVRTVQEFNRPRFLYQLTAEGETAERAITWFRQNLEQPGELQAAALGDIQSLLLELRELQKSSDRGKIHLALRALGDRFTELTSRAQAFISGLQRAIDLHGVGVEEFLLYKSTLIDYLERFIRQLVISRVDIARLLQELGEAELLLSAAVDRELEDALEPTADDRRRLADSWRRRWHGLRSWFTGVDGSVPQAEMLRSKARSAIPAMLATVTVINERRINRSDRASDFRTLALWFAQTDNDSQAHRLWRAAFGMSPCRHLKVDEETLDYREASKEGPNTSWMDSRPLQLAPRLRKTGRTARRGALAKIVDRTEAREELEKLALLEAEQIARAHQTLATNGEVRLSDMKKLEPFEFELFLDFLGEVLQSGQDETTSADGTMNIRFRPTNDGKEFVLQTSDGSFRGPDHFITLESLI